MDTPEMLREQINDFFPSYYTTLISIIQATSFGYLLVSFSNYLALSNDPISYHLVLYLINFSIIIAVWYEYMMGSASLRWLPNILDSVLPFLLGMAQFSLIYFAKAENIVWYYWSFSLLCLFSYFAYANMYKGSDNLKTEKNILVLKLIGIYPKINKAGILSIGLISAIFALMIQYLDIRPSLFACIMLIILILFIVRGYFYWKRIIDAIS